MNFWKIILATVVIFGAGVITGGLLVHHVDEGLSANLDQAPTVTGIRPPTDAHAPVRPEVPLPRLAERLNKEFVRRLVQSLQLTLVQSNNIAKIVADGQDRNHVIWTNVAPQMRKVMQEVNQQIRAELTPEQLQRFEELMKTPRPAGHHPGTNAPPVITNAPPGA